MMKISVIVSVMVYMKALPLIGLRDSLRKNTKISIGIASIQRLPQQARSINVIRICDLPPTKGRPPGRRSVVLKVQTQSYFMHCIVGAKKRSTFQPCSKNIPNYCLFCRRIGRGDMQHWPT